MLLENFIDLFLDSAPWLLLGLVLAGMLKMFVPMAWMQKQLGGHSFKTTVKAALLGAPLPLCSCGVIPAAVGLRRSGASRAATTSFLVSTPETGVDSIAISYVLLGPFMAIVRPVAAVLSAITAGLLVGRDDETQDKKSDVSDQANNLASQQPKKSSSCCSKTSNNTTCSSDSDKPNKYKFVAGDSRPDTNKGISTATIGLLAGQSPEPLVIKGNVLKQAHKLDSQQPKKSSSCCSKTSTSSTFSSDSGKPNKHNYELSEGSCGASKDLAQELRDTSIINRIVKGLHYAATDLVRDTTIWLLVGLFFAAIVQTYVPVDFMAKWGDGVLAMLVMVVISVPMYICATASTPIAAGLLLSGVAPGAVLVFMLAGPATNIATLGVVAKELGRRALFGYLGGVLGVAMLSGIIVNYLVATFGFEVMPLVGEQHNLLPETLVYASGIVLAILMAKVFFDMLPIKWARKDCCS